MLTCPVQPCYFFPQCHSYFSTFPFDCFFSRFAGHGRDRVWVRPRVWIQRGLSSVFVKTDTTKIVGIFVLNGGNIFFNYQRGLTPEHLTGLSVNVMRLRTESLS